MRLSRPGMPSPDDLVQDDILAIPSCSVRVPDDAGPVVMQGRQLFHPGRLLGAIDALPDLNRLFYRSIRISCDAAGAAPSFKGDESIIRAVKMDDRHGRMDQTGINGKGAGDRGNRRNLIRYLRGQTIGHHRPVGYAGDIDPGGIDMELPDHIRDELADKGRIVDVVLLGVTATTAYIPRQKPLKPSAAVRIDNDKAVSLRGLGEPAKPLHLFSISAAAMESYHERGVGGYQVFRAMDEKGTRGWAYDKGILLGIGVVMIRATSGKKYYRHYQNEPLCECYDLAFQWQRSLVYRTNSKEHIIFFSFINYIK